MSWIWEWTSRLTWLEMNMQVDVVPLSEKAAPKLVLGNRPDCQNKMFLQGENTLLPGQEPIVSALLFRKSTQAEQQRPRPPVNIPCSVHDSEDVKPWEMEMGWAGWGVLWSLAFTSLLVWAGQLHHSVCQSGTGHVATWTWGVTWLIFVPALRLPTCTCTDWKQAENCSFLLKQKDSAGGRKELEILWQFTKTWSYDKEITVQGSSILLPTSLLYERHERNAYCDRVMTLLIKPAY